MSNFTALVKPASSLCNMKCDYCFYHDVAANRSAPSCGIMNKATAHSLVDRVFDFCRRGDSVSFMFQGGEPLLAGADFFEDFVGYAKQKNDGKFIIEFSLQTNGLLIDDRFCSLFAENRFLVGVSLDGYAQLHDLWRKDAEGKPTYSRAENGIRLLKKHSVDFNVLCVVTAQLAAHAGKILNSLIKSGAEHIQPIPCLMPLNDISVKQYTLTPRAYGRFLIELYDAVEHARQSGAKVNVRLFDNIEQLIRGGHAEQCGMNGCCTPQFVVEADGSVYPCDFYALDEYSCGNILRNSVAEIAASDGLVEFLKKNEKRPPHCEACKVFNLCMGGCSRYRSFLAADGEYCPTEELMLYIFRGWGF